MSETPGTVLIEADTIESALEALTDQYGADATIVSAERVRKGGLAGFFATEVVELVAIPPLVGKHTPGPDPSEALPTEVPTGVGGVDTAFAQLLDAAEQAETEISHPASTVALLERPAPKPGRPGAAAAPASNDTPVEGIRWDAPRLIEIGLPGSLIEDLMPLDPSDDLAHVDRLARSIAPLTGDMPAEPHRMIGTRQGRHHEEAEITDRARPVHLVLARGDELDVTKPPPAIVSWTHDASAPTAIAVAWQTGAVLGWSASDDGSIRRVTPVDAALAIRRLLDTP